MEFCDDGDLMTKITDQAKASQQFSEDQILYWFTMIALGIKHFHDRHVIHRDIKAQNIFLCRNGMAKVGDFGVASVLNCTSAMV